MPYSSVSELPAGVKKKYSPRQQRAFRSAFNSAKKQGKSEAQAFKIAHQAAKKAGGKDSAMSHVECPDCPRTFLDGAALVDHAESVHTHSDKRTLVRRAVRSVHGKDSMLVDLSDDWLIYDAWDSEQSQYSLYKQSYSMDDAGTVKLTGEPSEVIRRITYIPAPKIESASATLGSIGIGVAAADPIGRAAAYKSRTDRALKSQDEASSQTTIEYSAAVKCPDCTKTFETPIEMKMHRKKAHKGDSK